MEDILKCTVKKYVVMMWSGFVWEGYAPVADCCKHGNGPPVFIKEKGFLD